MTHPTTTAIILLLATGCATTRTIAGAVTDRNGQPVERAIVSVKPGDVELVTDQAGAFTFDYLRDEHGERTKLSKRTDYHIEVFKPGYHVASLDIHYKRGELALQPITVQEDTIRVAGSDENIDPGQYPDRTHSAGATYEGE